MAASAPPAESSSSSSGGFCFSINNCLPQHVSPPAACLPGDKTASSVSSTSSSSSSSVESKNSALFQLALAYQAQGSLDQAVKIYEEVIKVDNDHHDAWCE